MMRRTGWVLGNWELELGRELFKFYLSMYVGCPENYEFFITMEYLVLFLMVLRKKNGERTAQTKKQTNNNPQPNKPKKHPTPQDHTQENAQLQDLEGAS